MASIEVVRGIASGSRSGRKASKSLFGMNWFSKDRGKSAAKEGKDPSEYSDSPLGFTVYRKPPVYVGAGSVLVQIWGVGLDGTDACLVGTHRPRSADSLQSNAPYGAKGSKHGDKDKARRRIAPVGHIPGRSFVGRVLEVGWEVGVETVKRGDWVVGLMSVHKCGALAEFVLVDRHRIHRIPHPFMPERSPRPFGSSFSDDSIDRVALSDDELDRRPQSNNKLSVNELALLPLCGVPAYRAVRTFNQITLAMGQSIHDVPDVDPQFPHGNVGAGFAASEGPDSGSISKDFSGDVRPRALVLRGHDGPGALAAQMLVRQGWSVWAHVPVPFMLPGPTPEAADDLKDEDEEKELEKQRRVLRRIEERLRAWDSVVALLSYLSRSRVRLDAIFDTVGGREIWEVGRSLLGRPVRDPSRQDVDAQFTTIVGDAPDRVVSTAGDNFRAGVRALRIGGTKDQHSFEDSGYQETINCGRTKDKKLKLKPRPVNYSWVNIVSDVDWEGGDIHDTLKAILRVAMNDNVKPIVGPLDFPGALRKDKGKRTAIFDGGEGIEDGLQGRVVPFENTPGVFIPGGGLEHGGTIVSRVAG
ncbi:hypothetical protein F5I97DRAFT_1936104 [Phlebopus sp. FC_14]|nr:hypothetical protein F5I97DRAFT_1936104 [Phlebopus sp. FC_14]